MPSELADLQSFGVDVFGDFEVCPLTHQAEGEMQMVCIEAAQRVVIVDHRPEDNGGRPITRRLNGRIIN